MKELYHFIQRMPKAELHIHVDGALEPEQMLQFAERNKISIPYTTVQDIEKARRFEESAEFYDAFNIATQVLRKEGDFYELMWSYLEKSAAQGVVHAEVIFDIRTYTNRGLLASHIINPLYQALSDAYKKWGITGGLMLCFLRHLSEADAFEDLQQALPYKDKILAVDLAANETGNPARKFARVFAQAKAQGYHLAAHAGEHEGPHAIRETIDVLQVERIDHGVRCVEDAILVQQLAKSKIPLMVCPNSNRDLKVFASLKEHPIKKMFNAGLAVSIHSDDPAYFGGYIGDNYWSAYTECGLTIGDLIMSAQNSFKAAFIAQDLQDSYLQKLQEYVTNFLSQAQE